VEHRQAGDGVVAGLLHEVGHQEGGEHRQAGDGVVAGLLHEVDHQEGGEHCQAGDGVVAGLLHEVGQQEGGEHRQAGDGVVAGLLHEVGHQEGGEHHQAGEAIEGGRVAPMIEEALADEVAVIVRLTGIIKVYLTDTAGTFHASVFVRILEAELFIVIVSWALHEKLHSFRLPCNLIKEGIQACYVISAVASVTLYT